ncbi:myb-related transcription factor, partner of profilin-like [Pleurodeles waltl]|uniref:myb-related transcription factor, partner of profilin-like n=1 Tax=Pleurodeles waltl TaxID=8319 RepID=UPI003709400F
MATDGNVKEKGDRKCKLKFSEQELEVLTEEVVRNHGKLFGKNSLQVPKSEKRKLWSDIQTKICAVGLAQPSVEEICKCWYDLRSRAKERVASRLKEARRTGGGPPTQTLSTPMEDMVESTLLPEAVSGVTEIDNSGTPSNSKDDENPVLLRAPAEVAQSQEEQVTKAEQETIEVRTVQTGEDPGTPLRDEIEDNPDTPLAAASQVNLQESLTQRPLPEADHLENQLKQITFLK